MNGRSFTNLAILVPGAAPGAYDPTNVGVLAGSAIAFNGVPSTHNSWEIDGTNNTDQGSGATANMVYPNVDAISEFRITTSTYSAEYGKNAGATVEVATKAGTNKFHGDLFEFVRNKMLDANDWFPNRTIGGLGPGVGRVQPQNFVQLCHPNQSCYQFGVPKRQRTGRSECSGHAQRSGSPS